jgi:methylthioribulose-1-phosphate dehydratase
MTAADSIASLIDIGREFYRRGWMLGTAGNLSVRLSASPLRYAVTVSGGHKGRLTADEFIELSAGMTAPSDDKRPSAETVVHDRLYVTRGPGAVLHVHSPYAVLASRHLAVDGRLDVSGWEYVKGLGFWDEDAIVRVPVVHNHAHLPDLGDAVAQAAGEVPCVLVDGHGVYAWGDTVADAQRHVECLEALCHLIWETAKR